MVVKHYGNKRKKRHLRIRNKISGTAERPRLSVFRSNKHIYAQAIDDVRGETLVSASDRDLKKDGSDKEIAGKVGKILAKKALKTGIKEVVFDRGGYRYHGRVKALAEGARDGGLKF